MGEIMAVMMIGMAGVLYFLPALVAHLRRAENENVLTICNVLFGWTGIGWLILLLISVILPRRGGK